MILRIGDELVKSQIIWVVERYVAGEALSGLLNSAGTVRYAA